MNLVSTKITLDGSGDGTGTLKTVHGSIAAVFVDKQAQSADPDVTLTDAFGREILAVTGITANTLYPLAVQATGSDGAAIDATYKSPPVASDVSIAVSGGDASGVTLVYVYYF